MMVPSNIYFELTDLFNDGECRAVLGSGQAVVHYRLAIMSKDGDWIVREDEEACSHIRAVLAQRGARYRAGAPLDVRWLAGGWSSHFEFRDARERRVRCDFFSRPPRIPRRVVESHFSGAGGTRRAVVGVEELILMKRTQRAKDYPVIGELARRLPPEREIEYTTDPDRVLALAESCGTGSSRRPVQAALAGRGRLEVVRALAEEADEMQLEDRRRLESYARAARPYLADLARLGHDELRLPDGHERLCRIAEERLPTRVAGLT